jgi:hypothetical protein
VTVNLTFEDGSNPALHLSVEEWVPTVPPKFNTASTLKIDIKPGDNTGDFALQSE